VQHDDTSQENFVEALEELAEGFWSEASEHTGFILKRLLEESMEQEIQIQFGLDYYEHSPKREDWRNGYYQRELLTPWGLLQGISVPRSRKGTYEPKVLTRYQRRHAQVDQAVLALFLAGISTRKIAEALEPLLGKGVSAQTVSRIAQRLDREVRAFHRRPLLDRYQYLLLDGLTLKCKTAAGVKKRLILCAYGITKEGQREMIDWTLATAESEASWTAFLEDLTDRGLKGKALQLVVIDGCPGLHAAVSAVFPLTPIQRCWVHKLRNVAAKLKRRDQAECLRGAAAIYDAPHLRAARQAFREWAARWRKVCPKAVACVEEDLEEMLAFMDCPKGHWRRVRTTNPIERAFREVRRRTRTMSCFNNPKSIDRILFGVLSHLNSHWRAKPIPKFTQEY